MITDVSIVLRLVSAVLLGSAIGFERQHRRKSAGLRTHILVCLGSCLVTILSVNMYASVQGYTNADPARLAAQVVSGIGFLGAGAIIKDGFTIRGLTTAASLWVVASVGIAIGAGSMVGATVTTVLVVMVLEVLPRIESLYHLGPTALAITIKSLDKPGQVGRIGSYFGSQGISIKEIHLEPVGEGIILIPLTIVLPNRNITDQMMTDLADIEGIIAIIKE